MKTAKLFGLIALVAVIGLGIIGCDNGTTHTHDFSGDWKTTPTHHWHECPADGVKAGDYAEHTFVNGVCNKCQYDNGTRTTQYTAQAEDGSAITLIITSEGTTIVIGDGYVLTITKDGETTLTSTGTVSGIEENGEITLQPTDTDADPFTVTVEEENITDIEGEITSDDGETVDGSEITIVPPEPDPVCECDEDGEGCICDEDCDCENCEVDPAFTEEEVQNLIDEAEALVKEVTEEKTVIISVDGSDVPESEKWVTQEEFDALTDAIDDLKEAAESEVQADIDEAYLDLEQAIKDFEEAKKDGTQEEVNPDPECECNGVYEDCECGDDCECEECESGNTDPDCGHEETAWHTHAPATCTAEGTDQLRCNNCHAVLDTRTTNMIKHDLAETNAKAATCEAEGNPDYWTCSVCHKHFEDEDGETEITEEETVIAALEHDYEWKETKAPTFTANGEETQICKHDESHHGSTQPIPQKAITDLDVLSDALAEAAQAGTPADPIPLRLELDLGTMGLDPNNWTDLLDILNTAGKYVSLDLSGCTMTGTEFSTGAYVDIGLLAIIKPDGIDSIVSIALPDSVTSIGDNAFDGCSDLRNITIPDSVTSIGVQAFLNCTSLASVDIPDSVTSIGGSAFSNCTGLTSVTVDPNNPNYISQNNIVYNKAMTTLVFAAAGGISGSVTIPDSVTSIEASAFHNCTGLTSVTIGNSVTYIGRQAFENCTNLTSITIPDSVTYIAGSAFYNCTSLTGVTIPASVTIIGQYAFEGCTSLTGVTILAETPPTLRDADAFNNTNNCPIYVPAGSVDDYKTAPVWSTASVANRIEAIQ